MESQSVSASGNMEDITPLGENQNFRYDYEEFEGNDSETEFHPEETSVASNVTKTTKSRKTTSSVWLGMERFEKELEDGIIYKYARCKTCGRELSADTHNGTSNMRTHLKRCPGSHLYQEENSSQTILSQDSFGSLVAMAFDQKRLEKRCIVWIICAELSFRTVEHIKFKEFVNDLQPKFKIPNRKAIARGVLELFLSEKESLKTILNSVRVSLTTNTWTSIQNINYMVVTAHFLDEGWKLHKRIISFKKIVSHKGDELGKVLDSCLIEWGIQKVFSITLDNASANDGLIEYVKRRLSSRGTLLSGGIYLHMRCACHILNLIVKDGMKELGSSIEAIRNCVKFIHSSPARLDMFRSTAVEEGLDASSTIGLDVVTRWNSTYKMLQSAMKFKQVFEKMTDDCDNFRAYFREEKREGPPADEHWTKASSLAIFLERFYVATNELSASKTTTSNLVLTTILSLRAEILMRTNDPTDKTLQGVAESMKKKFDKYWGLLDELCPIMFVAQALDPRVKFEMIEVFFGDKIETMKALVKHNLSILFEEYKKANGDDTLVDEGGHRGTSATTSCTTDGTVSSTSESVSSSSYAWAMLTAKRQSSHKIVITNEVDKYFSDDCESSNNISFDLLWWWKLNAGRYPILSMIARDVFAIPASSVASECAFSLGGRVVDPFRASLTPKTVEALVCTSDWLRGEDYQFSKEPNEDEVELYKELEELEKDVTIPTVEVVETIPTPIATPTPIPKSALTPAKSQRGGGIGSRGGGRTQVNKRTTPINKPPLPKRPRK